MSHKHTWEHVKDYWVTVIIKDRTYTYKELYQLYRCTGCQKLKEEPSGIRRINDER